MIDDDDFGAVSEMDEWQRKSKYREETCPSAAVPTTGPTSLESDSNQGRRCGNPATNRPRLWQGPITHLEISLLKTTNAPHIFTIRILIE
jgi:hypothetical protein